MRQFMPEHTGRTVPPRNTIPSLSRVLSHTEPVDAASPFSIAPDLHDFPQALFASQPPPWRLPQLGSKTQLTDMPAQELSGSQRGTLTSRAIIDAQQQSHNAHGRVIGYQPSSPMKESNYTRRLGGWRDPAVREQANARIMALNNLAHQRGYGLWPSAVFPDGRAEGFAGEGNPIALNGDNADAWKDALQLRGFRWREQQFEAFVDRNEDEYCDDSDADDEDDADEIDDDDGTLVGSAGGYAATDIDPNEFNDYSTEEPNRTVASEPRTETIYPEPLPLFNGFAMGNPLELHHVDFPIVEQMERREFNKALLQRRNAFYAHAAAESFTEVTGQPASDFMDGQDSDDGSDGSKSSKTKLRGLISISQTRPLRLKSVPRAALPCIPRIRICDVPRLTGRLRFDDQNSPPGVSSLPKKAPVFRIKGPTLATNLHPVESPWEW